MAVNYGALSALTSGIQAYSSVETSRMEADSLRRQGKYAEKQAKANARIAKLQAQDAIFRGTKDANRALGKARQLKGSQTAALASQGVAVDSGVGKDLQNETDLLAAIDVQTIKNNAWKEAWGYRMQASNYKAAGSMARIGADSEANMTLMTGGLKAVNYGTKAAEYGLKASSKKQDDTTKIKVLEPSGPNSMTAVERAYYRDGSRYKYDTGWED